MRKPNFIVSALVAICLLAAPLAFAQGGNPLASTKESGASSGRGMTAVEQTGKNANAEEQVKAAQAQLLQGYLKGDASLLSLKSIYTF